MSFMDSYLAEFDQEQSSTRQILELVPNGLLDWQAHDTLHTIGWVASHLADIPSWVEVTLKETSFDIAPVGGPKHETPVLDSTEEILSVFDANLAAARKLLAAATEEQLAVDWTLLQGGEPLFTMPRSVLIRNLFINHVIHHRAFLIAYLRINGISCPGLYG